MSAHSETLPLPVIASLVQEYLHPLPDSAVRTEEGCVRVCFNQWGDWRWKAGSVGLSPFSKRFREIPGVILEENALSIPESIDRTALGRICETLHSVATDIAFENTQEPRFWGKTTRLSPRGFDETQPSASRDWLAHLYDDQYIVKEKKAFVIDLAHSHSSYMVSSDPEPRMILDAAAQIASLAVGFNHVSKNALLLRPEIFETHSPSAPFDWEHWDVANAFKDLLRHETGLNEVYFVNSGAEAIETALRCCQSLHPTRRRVLAFEGSFHGRTLLALHCTYSPEKRAPFEIFPGTVVFNAFPETKTPEKIESEPTDWIKVWTQPESAQFQSQVDQWLKSADSLLKNEIQCLLQARENLLSGEFLAVAIEPMQCEGGDRYGTNRFFRGLRALTRGLKTPLIFDEVQTGFGLGGPFFWHRGFNLVDANGKPDTADVVVAAKKAQVGVCITHIRQEIPTETSPASVYRGYLQALEILNTDSRIIEAKTKVMLQSIQNFLGEDLIQAPRTQAYAYAFDLPDAELLKKLIERRFHHGVLFYPAGDRTARFRLMATTTDRELAQSFRAILECFKDLAGSTYLKSVPGLADSTLNEWVTSLPKEFQSALAEEDAIAPLPWGNFKIPSHFDEYTRISKSDWADLHSHLVESAPELLRSPHNRRFTLSTLAAQTRESLWKHYETTPEFTRLDLLWQSSRAFGHCVRLLSANEVAQHRDQIEALEAEVFEPARRDDPDMFVETAKCKSSIFVAAYDDSLQNFIGMCAAAQLKHFKDVSIVVNDTQIEDPKTLYSIGLSISKSHHGVGLGLRLKTEQLIEALNRGITTIRSRNRHPEAQTMKRLNRYLGAVVLKQNLKDYGGQGVALYQSISLSPQKTGRDHFHPFVPALRNKVSLANFVSRGYVNNLLMLKPLLPVALRHVYLSSGRAEAVEKSIKLLRNKRPKAHVALSFSSDYFGETTACARSLGGDGSLSYFDWPKLNYTSNVETLQKTVKDAIQKAGADQVLGLFVEPISEKTGMRKDDAALRAILDSAHELGVPVFFHESASAFFKYSPERRFCASEALPADGIFFYPGGQLGIVAVTSAFFLEKPLMMISTWDGDEHSLNLLRTKLWENP